ncbi:MAG: hypothetical protein E7B12_16735 [Clostridioides difficile]|nr:hypothetical protein [Clostridioides difficile]
MLGLKKRDIKKALKVGAKMGGVSLAEVRDALRQKNIFISLRKRQKCNKNQVL